MRRFLKVSAIVIGLLILAAVIAFITTASMGRRKFERTVDVKVVPVAFVKDPAAIKLGKYLFESRGCSECHGSDGRGLVYIDTP